MSLIKHAGGNGRIVAIAGEALIVGQVVKCKRENNEWKAYKVTATGDLTAYTCGLAFRDITTASRQNWGVEVTTTVQAAVDSKPWEEIKAGANLVVISGPDLWVDTDYVSDGNYIHGASLSVDVSTNNEGKLKLWVSGEPKLGRVDIPAMVASRNNYVRCYLSIGVPIPQAVTT